MKMLRERIALLVASSALLPALPAMAADYDPPVAVEQADEYVPVEVGSGWYLRGDVGYMFDKGLKDLNRNPLASSGDYNNLGTFIIPPFEDSQNDIVGSIGAGYHFNDYLRADANFGFLPNERYDTGDALADVNFRVKNIYWTGLVNGYIDLGTFAGLTPYVGAGVGFLYSKSRAIVSNATESVNYSDVNYDVLYAANAGFSYQVARNTSLDVGYQYMIAPDVKYMQIDENGIGIGKGIDAHTVKIGLRYDLW